MLENVFYLSLRKTAKTRYACVYVCMCVFAFVCASTHLNDRKYCKLFYIIQETVDAYAANAESKDRRPQVLQRCSICTQFAISPADHALSIMTTGYNELSV